VGRRSWAVIGAAGLTLATWTVAVPSAQAATTWQSGVKVGTPSLISWPGVVPIVDSYNGTAKCDYGTDASAAIKLVGDYMYVRDDCADGRSAVGMVSYAQGGETVKRICRNAHGNNTWARCNFDWPESAVKQFTAGVYNGSTGYLSWDFGRSIYFRD
jgi:hypothetical protein